MLTILTALMLASPVVVHDFSLDDRKNFSTVNDTVMGGVSRSRLVPTDRGTAVFSGDLSLDNNGGFTSFRSNDVEYSLAGTEGIELLVKGDGRTYTFSCDMAGVPVMAGGYWQRFETVKDVWVTVRLPYADFVPHSFGRPIRILPALDPARITSLGVLLADKQAGSFALELDEIRAYGRVAEAAADILPTDVHSLLESAIKRGVPLFNEGNPAACAAVYATAIEAVLAFSPTAMASASREELVTALERAGREDARNAAWTLRRAIDRLVVTL